MMKGPVEETSCLRCGQAGARGERCHRCADLHVLVCAGEPPSDGRGRRPPPGWWFEVWRDRRSATAAPELGGRRAEPVGTVHGFVSAREALARAHEFLRRYVAERVGDQRR
jgi:hypothetical protein